MLCLLLFHLHAGVQGGPSPPLLATDRTKPTLKAVFPDRSVNGLRLIENTYPGDQSVSTADGLKVEWKQQQ